MAYKIYLEGEELDTFKDENAIIDSSVQNINDISKIFTDKSKSFTVPASKKNNKIFKHFEDPDIDDGFDYRILKDAYIETGDNLFREGKIRLEAVKLRNGRPESYKIWFVGLLVGLKERFGGDYISDLDLSAYDHDYNFANVLTGVLSGLFSGDVIYPLFSFTKQWYYNEDLADDTNTDVLANIHFESGVNKGIKWSELKPAIKVSVIIDAIKTKYGLTLTPDFLESPVFDGLYLLANSQKGQLVNAGAESLINWTSR